MARENLLYAVETVERVRELRPDLFTSLVHKTRLDLSEVAEWKQAAHLMNVLNPASSINAVIILVGVSSVLFYFFFSIEHSGPGRVVARTGIIFLMIAFGAAFGYTVMARMSLLIGRLTDLIEFSDASYGRPTLWLALLTIAALVVLSRRAASMPSQSE